MCAHCSAVTGMSASRTEKREGGVRSGAAGAAGASQITSPSSASAGTHNAQLVAQLYDTAVLEINLSADQ